VPTYRRSLLLLGLAFAGCATSASAEPLPLAEPVSAWHASLEDQTCSLKRTFKLNDSTVALQIDQSAPFHGYDLSVVAEGLKRNRSNPRTQFGSENEPIEHTFSFRLKDGDWEGFTVSLGSNSFAAARETPGAIPFNIGDGFQTNFSIPLDLYQPLNILDQCLSALVTSWGFDPVVQMALTQPVQLHKSSVNWFYDALSATDKAREETGLPELRMLLKVDAAGEITSCEVYGALGTTRYEEQACQKAVKRARLKPALDANGAPVASFLYAQGTSFTQTTVRGF